LHLKHLSHACELAPPVFVQEEHAAEHMLSNALHWVAQLLQFWELSFTTQEVHKAVHIVLYVSYWRHVALLISVLVSLVTGCEWALIVKKLSTAIPNKKTNKCCIINLSYIESNKDFYPILLLSEVWSIIIV